MNKIKKAAIVIAIALIGLFIIKANIKEERRIETISSQGEFVTPDYIRVLTTP